jgi:hypothetical protein
MAQKYVLSKEVPDIEVRHPPDIFFMCVHVLVFISRFGLLAFSQHFGSVLLETMGFPVYFYSCGQLHSYGVPLSQGKVKVKLSLCLTN